MKKLICLLLLVCLAGCASVEFNPETGAVTYSRLGDQHIQGFEVKKTKDGFKVKLESQQSEAQALAELVGLLSVPR